MALADSGRSIGAVTRLLQDHLLRRGFLVSVGKPEQAALNDSAAKLNLFLYEAGFDATLRNHTLRDGEPPPLWLVLKYLLTAFDASEESDSADAHELLGRGLSALQELAFVPLDAAVAPSVRLALEKNPEPLKLTFDDSNVDLLSKIMQGTDERYRLSIAFQLRPVMIVPGSEPRNALLVGVDYGTAPQTIIGVDGVHIDVQPTLGARLDRVEPARFATGQRIVLFGDDLNGSNLEVLLGDVVLTLVERRADRLIVDAEGDPGGNPQGPIASGTWLSAGDLPLFVRQRLPTSRFRSSNPLAVQLLPIVTGATRVGTDLQLSGMLLGAAADDVVLALYRDGATARHTDVVVTSANQQSLTAPGVLAGLAAGTYRAILRVNNQQALSSPAVTLP